MCGLTGFLWNPKLTSPDIDRQLMLMSEAIKHRGPDDFGRWFDASLGVAIAHQRLSVLDLSFAGHQPMHSSSGRFTIAFNGEIYNHKDLKNELVGKTKCSIEWRGHSDTEILLACFEEWGVDLTLEKLIGMFSISLWDSVDHAMYLIRDRMGEKPMYYGISNDVFIFGSELKAIRAFKGFVAKVDRNSLSMLLKYSYIPSPFSIYKDVKKLPPGTYVKIGMKDLDCLFKTFPEPVKYWSIKDIIDKKGPHISSNLTLEKGAEALEELLQESVNLQMEADVPLGVFLSGGVDSSLVAALMQAESANKIKTFSIGFDEQEYNEAEYAKSVAQHLGTEHTEFYVTPDEALKVIPMLPSLFDEPFADSSQIPTFLVSKMAKKYVSVAVSGDGADELFGGYTRYVWANKIWKNIRKAPYFIRYGLSKFITTIPPRCWDIFFTSLFYLSFNSFKLTHSTDKIYKFSNILRAKNLNDLYDKLISQWADPDRVVLGAASEGLLPIHENIEAIEDFEHQMMYLDSMAYLPDDILVKVDRASMGVSLETRAPFLDHRIVEYSWQVPLFLKINNTGSKLILRKILHKYVPDELIDRPKMGFGVPIDSWLRGPLREWAERLISESRLENEGFFEASVIREKWKDHLSGKRNWQHHLWSVLMFQAWLEEQKDIQ